MGKLKEWLKLYPMQNGKLKIPLWWHSAATSEKKAFGKQQLCVGFILLGGLGLSDAI